MAKDQVHSQQDMNSNLNGQNQLPVESQPSEIGANDLSSSIRPYSMQGANHSEKDFVFDFRTFKEVFPYISSVNIADHSSLEQAYHDCISKHAKSAKKGVGLSNVVIIQFHKTEIPNSDSSYKPKNKEWTNFFTYIHVPFLDKNINTDVSIMSEIIGRAMEKKSETKVFDCLFRKSDLLMRLQDFIFPAYPSQRDFLATQTKLQVSMSSQTDLKKISSFFSQLKYFEKRLKNQILNEQKATILLTKYFDEDYEKIKHVVKDFCMSSQLLSLKQAKNYSAPGYENTNSHTFTHLMNFLSFSHKNTSGSKQRQMGSTQYYSDVNSHLAHNFMDYGSQANPDRNYMSLTSDGGRSNKLSVASVGYKRGSYPIRQKNQRDNIERRIHLDDIKKQLCKQYEREIGSFQSTPYNDIRGQIQSQISKFATSSGGKPYRSYKPMSAARQRRTTTAPSGAARVRSSNKNGGPSQQTLPSTMHARLGANRSGPINFPRKINKRKKQDKFSYDYFISHAPRSLSKYNPFYTKPATIKDQQSEPEDVKLPYEEEKDLKSHVDMQYEESSGNIPDYNNHEKPVSEAGDPYQNPNPASKRPISQQNPGLFHKRGSKLSAHEFGQDFKPKYKSLRQQKALSIKRNPNQFDDKLSTRSQLAQNRKKLGMNNQDKLRNVYKMAPSTRVLGSVLNRQ